MLHPNGQRSNIHQEYFMYSVLFHPVSFCSVLALYYVGPKGEINLTGDLLLKGRQLHICCSSEWSFSKKWISVTQITIRPEWAKKKENGSYLLKI